MLNIKLFPTLFFLLQFLPWVFSLCAEATLQVDDVPGHIRMGKWSGNHDLHYTSSPFSIRSVAHGVESTFSVTIRDYFSRHSKLLLYSADSRKIRQIPITITFRQLSNRAFHTTTHSEESPQRTFSQTHKHLKDFNFEFQLSKNNLGSLPSGFYSNHFSLVITNDHGERRSIPFIVSLYIPTLIKIGFTGDVFINTIIPGGWKRGTSHACIYLNGSGWYRARALSSNFQHNDYHMCKGGGGGNCRSGKIPYFLIYEGKNGPPGPVFRFNNPNSYSPWFQGSDTYFEECTQGISNVKIHADASISNIGRAPQGSYSDIVTIIVEPD